jgi:hypothetical protein
LSQQICVCEKGSAQDTSRPLLLGYAADRQQRPRIIVVPAQDDTFFPPAYQGKLSSRCRWNGTKGYTTLSWNPDAATINVKRMFQTGGCEQFCLGSAHMQACAVVFHNQSQHLHQFLP